MKKVLAAVICSTTVLAFGETASSHGSLTTVFENEGQETKVTSEALPLPEIDEPQLEKIGNINFEKESEAAPTTNQAKSTPEEEVVLEELEKIEAKVITVDSEGTVIVPNASEPTPKPAAEKTEVPEPAVKPEIQVAAKDTEEAASEPASVPQAPSVISAASEEKKAEELSDDKIASEAGQPEENAEETNRIVPSRSVTIKNNQYLDVVYAGGGWAYIGEDSPDKHMTFFGRKLGKGDTLFTLRSKKPGTTLLHFYKNDNLTGEYIDDYLSVTVENESSATGSRVTAPNYADIVPAKPVRNLDDVAENVVAPTVSEKPELSENAKPESNGAEVKKSEPLKEDVPSVRGEVKTVIENTTGAAVASNAAKTSEQPVKALENIVVPQDKESEVSAQKGANLLENAKKSFTDGKFESALSQTQEYLNSDTDREDEALYLLGQIYESESSVRNIRSSIDSYDTLVKNFPASSLWQKANQRVIYLKRFYIDIR